MCGLKLRPFGEIGVRHGSSDVVIPGKRSTEGLFAWHSLTVKHFGRQSRVFFPLRAENPGQLDIGLRQLALEHMDDVAAIITILLIGIGIAGKNVAPKTAQSNVESPATSGSQNQ